MGLNSERPQAEYNTSEQDLYTGAEMVWKSYLDHLSDFQAWKTTYTPAIGAAQLLAIDNARKMPDEAQRDTTHTTLKKQLELLNDTCLEDWKKLESYIKDGFPPLIYQDMLNGAGYGYYEGASRRDWEDTKALMNDGEMFIAAKASELTTGGMIAGFDVTFSADKQAFEQTYSDFLQAEEHTKEQRDEKVDANNLIYRVAMAMCGDAKKVFRKQPAIREQFTWSKVQKLIKAKRALHSVKGTVSEVDDGPLLAEALVEVLDKMGVPLEGKETVTADDGTYRIIGLKNGEYRLRVTLDGYLPFELPFKIDGKALDLDAELEPEGE